MTSRNIKLFIGISILLAYISIGVLGLLEFNHAVHSVEMPMVNCPYSENSSSLCDNSLNHINNWRQFSNVISPSFFIFSILILGIILHFFAKGNFLNQKQYFYKWKYYLYDKKLAKYPNRIIKWLSLLENSPAFSQ